MRGRYTPHGAVRRFVEANYLAAPDGPCVVADFPKSGNGRVRATVRGERRTAHSYATELRLGPAPEGMVSLHDCREPNCIIHTRWGTQLDNIADMERDGTRLKGEGIAQSKLTDDDVQTIRGMLDDGVRQRTIATWFKTNQSTISLIASGHTWRHI